MTAVIRITGPDDDTSPRHVLMQQAAAASHTARAQEPAPASFGFADFLDVINPLQHIPGVSDLYRAATHDQISEQAQQTGRTLYGLALGGPVGVGLMMAYDALSGLNGAIDAAEPAHEPLQLAAASSVLVTADDVRKPETDEEPALLGEKIASAGQRETGVPLDLTQFWEAEPGTPVSGSGTGQAKNVQETDRDANNQIAVDLEGRQKPVVPDSDGLGRLATHEANHLSLDVLKVLQERHAKLTASQQS